MSVPMFSSAPAQMYPGNGWEARMHLKEIELWCPVILFMPTEHGADVLVAMTGSEPRWYRNVEVRRISGSSDASRAVS